MLKIILEQADNGVIKTIHDDNINGAGESYESKVVYDMDKNKDFSVTKEFLYGIAYDLNIDTGNKFDRKNLVMSTEWGQSYTPTEEEIDYKIKTFEIEIAYLQELLRNLKKEDDNI